MERDHLVVREGGYREVVQIEETIDHGGNTFARVSGSHLGGWVEIPSNPIDPEYTLVCEDCGRVETPDDDPGPLRKQHRASSERWAHEFRKTHEAKRPTHNPRVEARPPKGAA